MLLCRAYGEARGRRTSATDHRHLDDQGVSVDEIWIDLDADETRVLEELKAFSDVCLPRYSGGWRRGNDPPVQRSRVEPSSPAGGDRSRGGVEPPTFWGQTGGANEPPGGRSHRSWHPCCRKFDISPTSGRRSL